MNIDTRRTLAIALCATAVVMSSPAATAERDATVANPTPEQRADAERMARFLDDTLHASNLRLRVMAGSLPDSIVDDRWRRTYTPIDELADSARGSTDPMVLALLIDPCANDQLRPIPTCDAVDLARRWTVAETQNQVAWLTLSSTLRRRDDPVASRAAFERASTASMWHEYYDEGLRVAAAAIPKDLTAPVRLTMLRQAGAIAAMQLLPNDALSALSLHCKDATLRAACARIVDTIARDSGSLLSSQFAVAIAARVGIDPSTIESRERALDTLRGAWIPQVTRDASEVTDTTELAEAIATAEHRIELGELPSLRAMLALSGMTEAASANRYRQYIAGLMEQAKAAASTTGNDGSR